MTYPKLCFWFREPPAAERFSLEREPFSVSALARASVTNAVYWALSLTTVMPHTVPSPTVAAKESTRGVTKQHAACGGRPCI